ncbi:DNA circularization protein [Undibacterium sp. SXout20W]|uniref:DNA circularization protein n=1 Tax=Undibacterium sp. SXout20W TaxID=3413051 RepID=UPI003BF03BC9
MSLDNILGSVQSISGTISNGVNLANRLIADVGGGLGSKAAYWKDKLRPASFRGVQFGVFEGHLKFGRRAVIHEYPFRDTVWVEDLGRSARRVAFNGFLVGEDCINQRDKLISACEDVGAIEGGELMHPTLGRMKVSLAEPVSCVEHWDKGRYFELSFSFIEQGKRIFPNSTISTGDAVNSAASAAKAATSKDFLSSVIGALKTGVGVIKQAVNTVQGWARAAQAIVNDATNLYHYVQSLPGEFGRFFGENTISSPRGATNIPALIALGAVNRQNVAAATQRMFNGVSGMSTVCGPRQNASLVAAAVTNYTISVSAFAQAVSASTPSTRDALRVLINLVQAVPALPAGLPMPTYPASTVTSINTLQAAGYVAGASSDLLRRSALIALAQAATVYQPTSYDDAVSVKTLITNLLDAEIWIAGNQGQDATYETFRTLRAAVVQDLTERGANLATLVKVKTPQSLPALALAQRLYRDSARADQLVIKADPIHPAFMPVSFSALSS